MRPETSREIEALLQQMKTAAMSPEIDRMSDEIRALVRREALPVLPQDRPTVRWMGNTAVFT